MSLSVQVQCVGMWKKNKWRRVNSSCYIIIFGAAGAGTNTHAGNGAYKVFPGIWHYGITWWMMPNCRADVYSKHESWIFFRWNILRWNYLICNLVAVRQADTVVFQKPKKTSKPIWLASNMNMNLYETRKINQREKDLRDVFYSLIVSVSVCVCVCVLAPLWHTKSFAQ